MIDNSKEYILCAAIKIVNEKDAGGEDLIYCGYRHNKIFWQQHKGHRFNLKEHIQGFLTSHGNFVDREEGAKLAFNAGQISEEKENLYSEDLYRRKIK